MKNQVTMFAGIAILLFFLQCTHHRFPVLPPVRALSGEAASSEKAVEYFVASQNAEYQGLDAVAEGLLEQAHRLDPSSDVLRDQLVRKYLTKGKYLQALVLIRERKKAGGLDSGERRMVAGIYVKTGEFARAIETLEGLGNKSDADYYSLGLLYESLDEKDKALKSYSMLFERTGGSVEIGLKIARLEASRQRFSRADSFIVALQESKGEEAPLISMRGTIALLRGDTAAALDFFNKAIAHDSTSEEGARGAAQIYLERNDYPGAIACYERLRHISPLYKEVFGRTVAILHYYNRDYSASAQILLDLLENANDDAELHYYLGLVSASQKKNDVARIELEKAVALKPDFSDAWRELCNISLRERNYDQGLAVAQRFLAAQPEDREAWRVHAYVLTLKKEYSNALKSLHKVIALDSLDSSGWFELGTCHERNKDIGKASDAFRRVLKIKPGDPTASNFLGYIWAENRMKLDSAQLLIETALGAEPGNGAYLDSYAWVWFQKGNLEKAISYMLAAMQRIRDDPVVFEHYGDILLKSGNIIGAIWAYQSCLELTVDDSNVIRNKIIECEALLSKKR